MKTEIVEKTEDNDLIDPTCVLNDVEVTCDPYTWSSAGSCCIPGDCY